METESTIPSRPCQVGYGKTGRSGPGNRNAVNHGVHAYKAMLNGDGLDEDAVIHVLREKEWELVTTLDSTVLPSSFVLPSFLNECNGNYIEREGCDRCFRNLPLSSATQAPFC
jgi:hypothetical protein